MAESNNRDPKSIGVAFFANWFDERGTLQASGGERLLLSGGTDAISDDISRLEELGVTDLILNFQRDNLEKSLDSMAHFVETIQPRIE